MIHTYLCTKLKIAVKGQASTLRRGTDAAKEIFGAGLFYMFDPRTMMHADISTLSGGRGTQSPVSVDSDCLLVASASLEARRPGFHQLDLSLYRTFAMKFRALALELGADGFSALNRRSFSNPEAQFSDAAPDARVIRASAHLVF